MSRYLLDMNKYVECARSVAAESCVLLKNDKQALPLTSEDNIAVFGRSALNYYKSGLGSGGLVNVKYVVGVLDALKASEQITLNEELIKVYEAWIKENPFDEGQGWGKVPWSQKEMPLEQSVVEAAKESSNVALVIIGRTAGEDQDAKDEVGSYRLTVDEEDMIQKVTATFERVVVILNVGNIIDMSWVERYNPAGVLYVWQGGQEGGHGVLDVLTGDVNPSGKLANTIAKEISDYPSTSNFGDKECNVYAEDIYVGYRYFETFAKDKVLYPFGFGLSYTSFEVEGKLVEVLPDAIHIEVSVKNTGDIAGKEAVQVYVQTPIGKLGKAARSLVGFAKTQVLESGASEKLSIKIDKSQLASYDDSGVTGNKSCYVLEEGTYSFYAGTDVRRAQCAGSYQQAFCVVEQLSEAMAPVEAFSRLKADAGYEQTTEEVPTRTIDLNQRIASARGEAIPYTGDKGYKLKDVFDGDIDLDTFVGQLSDEDMACLIRGEGMCSPKATPGTAAAFGGVTPNLEGAGIPVACCADGPSGIRMDCGTKAFSIPNGTALACTFNTELVEELSKYLGLEIRKNNIDTLLGPGINIHRNPLNGRNFEYFSEDPLHTGEMAVAQLKGMADAGVTGTLKHFVANNQEVGRHTADAVISERALREIYLKGFEIAVKKGGAYSIMTSYGPVNGLWTAGNYDLCTTLLREEWGFDGIVMTDWWAKANFEGEKSQQGNTAPMVRAQNDIYMCVPDALSNPENDNTIAMLEEGFITRWELQRNVKNILRFIMRSPVMLHALGRISQEELEEKKEYTDEEDCLIQEMTHYTVSGNQLVIDASSMNTNAGHSEIIAISFEKQGEYDISFRMKSDLGELAQLPISIFIDNLLRTSISVQGSNGRYIEETRPLGGMFGLNHYMKLYFGQTGLQIDTITIEWKKDL